MGDITNLKQYCDRVKKPYPEFKFDYSQKDANFTCSMQFQDIVVTASGWNKKTAKQAAATKLWNIVQESDEPIPAKEAGGDSRFVREVNQLCQKEGVPMPTFEIIKESGPPHRKLFTMECKFADLTATATASKKKDAKNACCEEMLALILKKREEVFFLKTLFPRPQQA